MLSVLLLSVLRASLSSAWLTRLDSIQGCCRGLRPFRLSAPATLRLTVHFPQASGSQPAALEDGVLLAVGNLVAAPPLSLPWIPAFLDHRTGDSGTRRTFGRAQRAECTCGRTGGQIDTPGVQPASALSKRL
jgi:hypothetical protein